MELQMARAGGGGGYRASRRTVTLVRQAGENSKLFAEIKPPDHGTDERALRQGGISIGLGRTDNGGYVKVAYAKASGPFEELVLDGRMGAGRERSRREKAAERFRVTVACAGVRVKLSGGYLQSVGGRAGIDLEAEENEQRNRRTMQKWSKLVGGSAFNLLLDLLHLGAPIPASRVAVVADALTTLADLLRIDE